MIPPLPGTVSLIFDSSVVNPGGSPVDIKVNSHNIENLQVVAQLFKNELKQFQGIYNIEDNMMLGQYKLLPVLRDRGRIWGISEAQIGKQLAQGFGGEKVLTLQRGANEVEVVVRYKKYNRNNTENFDQIYIRTMDNRTILLSAIAK